MEFIKNLLKPDILLHNMFVIIFIKILILLCLLKIIHLFLSVLNKKLKANTDNTEQKKQIHTIISTIKSVVDIVIVTLFVMEIMSQIGIDMRPILTAAGVLGVAVGFGSKRFVEDVISGFSLILQGQIQVGDIIETAGKFGIVEKLNLKVVVLRDWDGKVHYIRNGMIDTVTNYTRDYAYSIINIGVAYKENIDKVIQTVINIANEELKTGEYSKYITGDLEVLGLDKFSESSVDLKFRIKTKTMHQWAVTREFNRLIKNKFDELGIEIPFPQRVIHTEK